MKKVILLCGAMALCASMAFASGVDLTVTACPGNAGAGLDAGALDCAGGQVLTLLSVFQPAEALTDLTAMDASYDVGLNGDVNNDATFWNFDPLGTNPGALNSLHTRPGSGCTGYTNTWSVSGSGSAAAGNYQSPNHMRINALAYRPSALATTANQKLFGVQLSIDASTSAEAGGGSGTGCSLGATVTCNIIIPRTVSGNDGSPLTTTSLLGQSVIVNGGGFVIANQKHTWGQLKKLYR